MDTTPVPVFTREDFHAILKRAARPIKEDKKLNYDCVPCLDKKICNKVICKYK
jgi:hypothetical protein